MNSLCTKMDRFGLSENIFTQICNIFKRYPSVHKVLIFGSRATNRYRANSDIDLVFFGDDNLAIDLKKISVDLDDTTIPYLFDLVDYTQIKDQVFKSSVDKEGKAFYIK